MQQCGNYVGRAFQIMDDWLDFSRSGEIDNKPRGADISSGIFTLPVILLLNQCNKSEKIALEQILFRGSATGLNNPIIEELCQKYAISEEVLQIAHGFIHQAEELLEQAKPKANTDDIKKFLNSILVS